MWVANSVDRTVIRIDPVTGTPGRPISVEDGADGVAAGDGSVWVIGRSAGVLSRIDPASRTVAGTTHVGNEPAAVAVGPDAVWVANGADGTVSKIDPSSGHLEGVFPVGKQPSGIAVAADGHVWVANAGSATLTELDPATGHVIRTVPTGAPPGGVALDGETVYVAAQVPPSAHRGGTLTLAVANPPGVYEQPIPTSLDPASGYSAWELLTMTNDGLLGYSRAGGAESLQGRPRPRHRPPDGQRRRPHVHLPAAQGDPLLDRRGRPARRYPPRDRARAARERRPDSRALPGRDRAAPAAA